MVSVLMKESMEKKVGGGGIGPKRTKRLRHTHTHTQKAAANLQLDAGLVAAFEKAQQSKIRWMFAKIDDVTFTFEKQGEITGSLETDLAIVKQNLKDEAMIFVCVDEVSSPKKWTLVAYVPETCKIKKRMLFASGRQDIKNKLGNSYFKGEAYCQDAGDFTVENIMRDRTEIEDLPYTNEELMMKQEVGWFFF